MRVVLAEHVMVALGTGGARWSQGDDLLREWRRRLAARGVPVGRATGHGGQPR